ncbi:MAG: ankyrin repeat domain-containing protein [Holosporaceae bacterium]|jgi:hypothetical protein|nr:ankyrin repeat domain-containing protein [Holosporaceae bacterium]
MKKILTVLAVLVSCTGLLGAMEIAENHEQKNEVKKSLSYIMSIIKKADIDEEEYKSTKKLARKLCFGSLSEQVASFDTIIKLHNGENSKIGASLLLACFARAMRCPYLEYNFRRPIAASCISIGNVEYFDLCKNIYLSAQKNAKTRDDLVILRRFCEADELLRAAAQCGDEMAQYISGANLVKLFRSISEKRIDGDDNMSGYLAIYAYLVERIWITVPVDGTTSYDLPTLLASLLQNKNISAYESCVNEWLKNFLIENYGENYITQNAFSHLQVGLSHLFQGESALFLKNNETDDVDAIIAQKEAEYGEYNRTMYNKLVAIAPVVRAMLVQSVFSRYVQSYTYNNTENELLECLSSENIAGTMFDINGFYCYNWYYGVYPLLSAAALNNDLKIVVRLFKAGADAGRKSTNIESTALHMAIDSTTDTRNLKIIKILAMAENSDAEDHEHVMAFEKACQLRKSEVAELLLDMFVKAPIDNPDSCFISFWNDGILTPSVIEKAIEMNRKFVARADGYIEKKLFVKGFAVNSEGHIIEK